MWNSIWDFLTSVPLWELSLIFFSKIIEVTIGTMRVILISKGYRKPGTFLAIFEILLWVFIASRVIMGITETPMKGVVYSLGFAIGVYIGSLLENRVAVGKILIYVILNKESALSVCQALRASGNGVTSIDAHGKDDDRTVLMIFANRKNKPVIIKVVESMDPKALIVSNEVSILNGGYVSPWRRIAK
ncbi:MAG: hypothetical protein A2013_00205 [Tenericutes bacterium GWE2_38_8]|nr:MAG: hypothetical protein A2013_00205 [Tenericutes bacterium GWE2_38_8]OHE45208.1 MAG: hypothetical protein A2102_05370 [Tenericutes bacterium GWF2_38_8]